MSLDDQKLAAAAVMIERTRDRMLADAKAFDAQAEALVHIEGAVFVVAKLRQAARDLVLCANSLPAFGLRPGD
jgi:hypothetical protein